MRLDPHAGISGTHQNSVSERNKPYMRDVNTCSKLREKPLCGHTVRALIPACISARVSGLPPNA